MSDPTNPTRARKLWDEKTATLTTKDMAVLAADAASAIIVRLAPPLWSEAMPYPHQMLLEETIKELQSRV